MATEMMLGGGEVGEVVKGTGSEFGVNEGGQGYPGNTRGPGSTQPLGLTLRYSKYSRFQAYEQQYSVENGLEKTA